MALKNPLLQRALGLTASVLTRFWRKTIDWRAVYFDPSVDPVHPQFKGRKIFACWHESMLMPIVLRGHRTMMGLASEHADGELIARAMHHLNWSVERGSTTRGGTGALIRMLKDDSRHISITPDGPRGPRRTMSLGAVFLASKLGVPVVCGGYGYDRVWRMRSWDRFAVPKPFARARAVYGPAVHVPEGLDRDGMERYRCWFEKFLNWATDEAEKWAQGRRHMSGGMPLLAWQTPLAMHNPVYHCGLEIPEALKRELRDLPQANAAAERRALRRAA